MAKSKAVATTEDKPVDLVTDVSEVERVGTKLVIPEGLALRDLLTMVKRLIADEEQEYCVVNDFDIILPEGMIAFDQAMKEVFGWSLGVTKMSMFGSTPPMKINIDIGPKKTVQASYGPIQTPGIDGQLSVGMHMSGGIPCLQLVVNVLNKHRPRIDLLTRRIKEIAAENSIYRGQAINLPILDPNNDPPLTDYFPKFLDLSNVHEEELIFSKETEEIIYDNVFGPLGNIEEYRNQQIPLKTGILMEGPYGCGKTLTALVLAKKAIHNGWTFFLVKDARNLKPTLDFAAKYQPCVIFCEDIDRVMDEGPMGGRTESIDSILNTIDGVMAKSSEMMVVLTTNNVHKISKAMLRPGRLDIVVSIGPPDAKAVDRLIRMYARGAVPVNEDLTAVCKKLDGEIPAMVREVVERSKRSAIARGEKLLNGGLVLRSADLERAANGLMRHLELLKENPIDNRSEMVKAAEIMAKELKMDNRASDTLNRASEQATVLLETMDSLGYSLEDLNESLTSITTSAGSLFPDISFAKKAIDPEGA